MKIIINESQLKVIVENENKLKLFPVPDDLLSTADGAEKAFNIYNKSKDIKGWDGIKIVGNFNYYDMEDDFFSDLNSFFNEIVYVDGNLVLPVGDYENSFNKLRGINGNLRGSDLWEISLPELEYIDGDVDLQNSGIKSLPKLKKVSGYLHLSKSSIVSLPELEYVGGRLGLRQTEIEDLPKLEYVGGRLILMGTPLSKKIVSMSEEDRVKFMKKINVQGEILL